MKFGLEGSPELMVLSKCSFTIILNIFVFILLSHLLSRQLFTDDVDGFLYQIEAVSSGGELGALGVVHQLRYWVVYPLYKAYVSGLPIIVQHLLLVLYLSPVLFMIRKIPKIARNIGVLLLYSSLFFSYRTVLLMESILLLVIFIYFYKFQKKYLFFSFLLSILSSGTVLVWLVLAIVSLNIKYKKIIILIGFILMLGPMAHKLLFFYNSNLYGSATSVSVEAVFNVLSFNNMLFIFENIHSRSLLNEAISNGNIARLSVIALMLVVCFILVILKPNKLVLLLCTLFCIGLLFEGLISYSLIFGLLLILGDYISRRVRFL